MSESHTNHTNRPDNDDPVLTIRGLYAYFNRWISDMEKFHEERDKRYENRFQSQDEKTTLALTASKEAISKAETATEKRFDAVNEFRGALSDQAAMLLPRAEANTKFENYDEKIANVQKEIQNLRESRSEGFGGATQQHRDRAQSNWAVERIIAVLIAAVAIVVGIIEFILRR